MPGAHSIKLPIISVKFWIVTSGAPLGNNARAPNRFAAKRSIATIPTTTPLSEQNTIDHAQNYAGEA